MRSYIRSVFVQKCKDESFCYGLRAQMRARETGTPG
jgi:hypothetical protein